MPGTEIDRIEPTRRPRDLQVLWMNWRDLLFLHWPVPAESLQPMIPPELEVDTFQGSAYVGLVPFTMKGVRPIGLPPVRGLSNFHETNVRTYVHHRGRDPGVWFFSLDAAHPLAVTLARRTYHLPYHLARMFLEHDPPNVAKPSSPILYSGVRVSPNPRPASYLIRALANGTPHPATPGTLEHFLIERYILYAQARDHLYLGRVHHQPYPVQAARVETLDETLLAAAEIHRPNLPPIAHFARGVDVRIYAIRKVDESDLSDPPTAS